MLLLALLWFNLTRALAFVLLLSSASVPLCFVCLFALASFRFQFSFLCVLSVVRCPICFYRVSFAYLVSSLTLSNRQISLPNIFLYFSVFSIFIYHTHMCFAYVCECAALSFCYFLTTVTYGSSSHTHLWLISDNHLSSQWRTPRGADSEVRFVYVDSMSNCFFHGIVLNIALFDTSFHSKE